MARTLLLCSLAGICLTLAGCGSSTDGAAPVAKYDPKKVKVDDLPPANPIPQAKSTLPPPVFKAPDNGPVVDDPPAQKNKGVKGAETSRAFTGTIKSVGGGSITITVQGQDHSFPVKPGAFVTQQRNRQPVTLDNVQAGATALVNVDLATNQITSITLDAN